MRLHGLALLALGAPLVAQGSAADHELTQEDFVRFARGIEVSINELRPEIMHEAFDLDAMLQRTCAGIEAQREALAEARVAVRASFGLAAELCNAVQLDGSYKLLSVHERGGEVRARYRLLSAGRLDYHELSLAPSRGGGVRITDCYSHVDDERASDALRRTLVELLATRDREAASRLPRAEAELARHASELIKIDDMIRQGRLRHALRLVDKLPQSLRERRPALLLGIRLARLFDGERYLALLARYGELYPGDASIDLLMIDYHVARANYGEALRALDRIEARVARDPYLDTLRGNVHFIQGRLDEAEELYARSLTAEPTLEAGYRAFLDLALRREDYGRVLQLLEGLVDRCHVELAELEGDERLRSFQRTPRYKDWLAGRRGDEG